MGKHALISAFFWFLLLPGLSLGGQAGQKASAFFGDQPPGFTLDILGNADMNWIIDARDLNRVSAIIQGTARPTPYADADGNGRIDPDDLNCIRSLINGTCRSVTVVDATGEKIPIALPGDRKRRVVTLAPWATRTLVQLGVQDTVVGVDTYTARGSKYTGQFAFLKACPDLALATNVGTAAEPSKEVLAALSPDLILAGRAKPDQVRVLKTASGCPAVYQPRDSLDGEDYAIENGPYENWLTLGYIFGRQDRALDIIGFCQGQFQEIREKTAGLSPSERRTIWYCSGKINRGSRHYSPIRLAGAHMPSAQGRPFFGEVQLEQVFKWDPDIILVQYWPHLAAMIEDTRKDQTLSLLRAVKSGQIFFIRNGRIGYDAAFSAAETWYIAKIAYPRCFADVDVAARADQMLEFFYGEPGLYTWEITQRPVFHTW